MTEKEYKEIYHYKELISKCCKECKFYWEIDFEWGWCENSFGPQDEMEVMCNGVCDNFYHSV